jgi:phosphoadenosine phosphosulfate reductase
MSQQTLPGYELSEADLIQIALDQSLDAKIDRAIALLQEYERAALKLSPDGYYLAFSGGKDSMVIHQLAIEAGVKFKAWYNLTTVDPPELVQFIKRHYPDVKWNRPKASMMTKLVDKSNGPPTRLARWCCEEYKEQGGKGKMKVIGVRIAESARRAKLWREFRPCKNGTETGYLAPIAYWTDDDVWRFIRERNMPYCELYDQGFKRLGCVGCPMAGPNMQAIEFARWPKIEARWKRAVFKFWDKWHGVPSIRGKRRWFEDKGSAQGLWDWWISGKASEGAAECHQQEMNLNR